MEPAPPPHTPAAGPGASPRRFRSARPSHEARAGRWGAPGSASRPRTSRAPSRSGQRVSAAARGLPAGGASSTRRMPGTRGLPCELIGFGRRPSSPQPAVAARLRGERLGGRGRSCGGRPAPRARRCRSPAAAAPRPHRHCHRRRLRAALAPRAPRSGLPPLGRGRHLPPRGRTGRGAVLPAPLGIPSRIARGSFLEAEGPHAPSGGPALPLTSNDPSVEED